MESSEDIATLINRLQSICTQLASLDAKVDDEDKIAVLLKALPTMFDQIVTVLKEKEPAPRFEDVINSLQDEEKKHSNTGSTSTHGAYFASTAKCKHCGRSNHKSNDCFKVKTCTICGKVGHSPSRCYKKDQGKAKGKIHLTSNEDEDNEPENFVGLLEVTDVL